MNIDIEKIKSGSMDGQTVYVCDYRRPDLSKKPVRSVAPQAVIIKSNSDLQKGKNIYYSESHFKAVGKNGKELSKIIPLFDNTGFRFHEGTPLKVFDNIDECVKCYRSDLQSVADLIKKKQSTIISSLQSEIDELKQLSEAVAK